jgi:hypothetical protein
MEGAVSQPLLASGIWDRRGSMGGYWSRSESGWLKNLPFLSWQFYSPFWCYGTRSCLSVSPSVVFEIVSDLPHHIQWPTCLAGWRLLLLTLGGVVLVVSMVTNRIENTASKSSSIVTCVSVAAVTWFSCCAKDFTEPLPSNGRLFWLHNSGFEQTCHNSIIFSYFCIQTSGLNDIFDFQNYFFLIISEK